MRTPNSWVRWFTAKRHHAVDAPTDASITATSAEDREHRRDDAVLRDEHVAAASAACRRSYSGRLGSALLTSRRSDAGERVGRAARRADFTIDGGELADERPRRRRAQRMSSRTERRNRCRPRSGC